jgi:hypothetical protein
MDIIFRITGFRQALHFPCQDAIDRTIDLLTHHLTEWKQTQLIQRVPGRRQESYSADLSKRYLTIKEYDPRFKTYQLAFPNERSEICFKNFLLPFYSNIPIMSKILYCKICHELESAISMLLTRLQASLPLFLRTE